MNRKWIRTFGAMALGFLANSSWAQQAGTRPQAAEPAVTVSVAGQKDIPIEMAPVPQVVGTHPAAQVIQGAPNSQLPAYTLDCNGCGQSCGRWVVGAGVYVLQPRWNSNPAFQIRTDTGVVDNVRNMVDFDYDTQIAPLAFVGYEWNSGFGIRGRWFSLEADNTQSFVLPPNTIVTPPDLTNIGVPDELTDGAIINATSSLSLHAFDIEATKRINNSCWSLLMSAGVRYANIDQGYTYLTVDPDTSRRAVVSNHTFEGFGPTLSLEGRRHIGDSGFAVYGMGRGSLLFGEHQENASQTTTTAAGVVTTTDISSTSRNSILSIGELEVGGEFCCDLGRCKFVGQVGFVGQIWWGAGNSANVDNNLNSDSNADLGLFGVVFRAGINF